MLLDFSRYGAKTYIFSRSAVKVGKPGKFIALSQFLIKEKCFLWDHEISVSAKEVSFEAEWNGKRKREICSL